MDPCRRAWPSVGLGRVSDSGEREHDNATLIIDGVPDAASPGDLELPLVEHPAADRAHPEIALQRMLAFTAAAWIGSQDRPGSQRRPGRLSRQLIPTVH